MRRAKAFWVVGLALGLLAACTSAPAAPGPTATAGQPAASNPTSQATRPAGEPTPGRRGTPTPESEGGEARGDGAELIYAPTLPASAQNAAFSPDGQTILFTVFQKGYNKGDAGLYLLGANDKTPRKLLEDKGHTAVNLPGTSWNATSNRIAFASDREDTDEIWTVPADGGPATRVTRHTTPLNYVEPSFSPDGQWLVFEASTRARGDRQVGSLWKVRADGSGLTQLTGQQPGNLDDRQPNWSPKGDRILFQRRQVGNDNWDLYTMDPDGNAVRQVTTEKAAETDASWSPDGQWLVYSARYKEGAVPNIWIIAAKGGQPIQVTKDPGHEDGAPSWSPDGQWIAFESHVEQSEDSPSVLWRIAVPALPAA